MMKRPLTSAITNLSVSQPSGRHKWYDLQGVMVIVVITGIFFLLGMSSCTKKPNDDGTVPEEEPVTNFTKVEHVGTTQLSVARESLVAAAAGNKMLLGGGGNSITTTNTVDIFALSE